MTETRGHDSRAVANEILRIADAKNIRLTLMQLLKVEFFAHGWCLALLNKPLSRHHAEAWKHGPVFPLVYKNYPGNGSMHITKPVSDKKTGTVFKESFDGTELEIMEEAVAEYASMHAFQLSQLSHEPDGPWDKTVREIGLYKSIPNEWIQEYFAAIKG